MNKYRKKPVVIEAEQFFNLEDYLKIVAWARESGSTFADDFQYQTNIMIIPTLEGAMTANPGDYIIKGVNGEFYPCKPEIFVKTYEKVK